LAQEPVARSIQVSDGVTAVRREVTQPRTLQGSYDLGSKRISWPVCTSSKRAQLVCPASLLPERMYLPSGERASANTAFPSAEGLLRDNPMRRAPALRRLAASIVSSTNRAPAARSIPNWRWTSARDWIQRPAAGFGADQI
jgi:hypothetical protein